MNDHRTSPTPIDYTTQCSKTLAHARQQFAALEALSGPFTIDTVIMPLNTLWMAIDRALSTASLYRNVHPDPEVRATADTYEQEFSKLVTDLGLSRPLYHAVQAIDITHADPITQRYVNHMLRDFRRSGVDQPDDVRAQVRQLKDELVTIGQAFGKNIRDDVRSITLEGPAELRGLPDDYIQAHPPGPDGKITITTDTPDYQPFMIYAHHPERRRALYTTFRQRGYPNNVTVLRDLLTKRHQLAQLLGYRHWAHYVTEDKMIKTAEAAATFIDTVSNLTAARAQRDYDELLHQLRKTDPDAQEVPDWQRAYLEEQVRRDKYALNSQEIRSYFSYAKVRQGILDLTSQMYGIAYQRVDAPVWHPHVEAYDVIDHANGNTLGRCYLDMHPRPNKYKHAAVFPLCAGITGKQLPEGSLVCNFPGADDPHALLEHEQVETFFHEFGHLLHHILGGKQPYTGTASFHTEWDFIEVPSQIFEEWGWDPQVLSRFATDAARTPIPDTLIQRMHSARHFGKGLWARHQMFYAALSLRCHDQDPTHLDPTALTQELQQRYSPFAYVDNTYFHYSFGHLESYSATYYTYMWSLVIAKDLFQTFEQHGLLNRDAAMRYRRCILEPGGSQDAADLVRTFLGRDYTFDAFSRWLERT